MDIETMGERQAAVLTGGTLAYHRIGDGEPVLLIHGITTYSFIWRRVIPLLHQSHDVITMDLLGCGDSEMPANQDYSILAHSSRLIELLDEMGLERAHIVGHDVGGGIAQIFAVHNPHRVLSLTLINSVAYDFWPVQPIIAMRTPIIRLFAMATLDLGALKLIVKRGLYHKDRCDDELMAAFWKPMQSRAGRKAFLHFARCLDNRHLMDISTKLRGLTMPVLILRGDADSYLTAAICEQLHREIPNVRLERTPTGGHFMMEDEPEWIAKHLLDHFAA